MKFISVFCIVFSSIALFSQKTTAIEYASVAHFTWSMFKGKINTNHLEEMGKNTAAVTVSSLSYTANEITGKSATIKIIAEFKPYESWTRYPALDRPDEALNHEKRHFDITEIYARKIRQLVSATRFSSGRFNEELSTIFKRLVSEHRAEQAKYDRETEHSMDSVEQLKWDDWIEAQLEALAEYSTTMMNVELK